MATESSTLVKLSTAFFYGFSSILVIFVNKILLTNLRFPSFLVVALGQMLTSVCLLYFARCLRLVSIPRFDRSTLRKVLPLAVFYLMNLVTGLGGTQRISLPMFTVLRRFSILMTMILEFVVLHEVPTFAVKISVFLMIMGSMLAAMFDLSFDLYGYSLILANDIFTALNGVYTKKKLEAKDIGKYGLLFYNSLLMLPPLFTLILISDDVEKVRFYIEDDNMTMSVTTFFLISCFCGFILNYSVVLCTSHNSALTTCCVGPIKNLIVTYIGMVSSGDYIFNFTNFAGINISVLGSILYAYVTFRKSGISAKVHHVTAQPIMKEALLPS